MGREINWYELDRLVDGQLAPHEYREMLRQIDRNPDGWRQCALAFLQHQAVEREMKRVAGFSDVESDLASLPEKEGIERASRPTPAGMGRVLRLSAGFVGICAVMILGISAGAWLWHDGPGSGDSSSLAAGSSGMIRNAAVTDKKGPEQVPALRVPPRASPAYNSQDVVADEPGLCGFQGRRDRDR